MNPFILLHELGHYFYTMKIAKKHNLLFHKPFIILGSRNKGEFLKSHHIKGVHILLFTKNKDDKTKGIVLYPCYQCFTESEIVKCAKAGWRIEFILSFLLVLISLGSLLVYSEMFRHWIFLVILFITALIAVIQSAFALTTFACNNSSDRTNSRCPSLFKNYISLDIRAEYYKFLNLINSDKLTGSDIK